MADNVTVDNGGLTDYDVSTDDAGASGQVQRVKLAYSADGSATHVPADVDGLLVNLGANNDVTLGAALPAGTNAIGKLAANSGVDIGDVDVTTVGTITPGTAATSLGKAEDAAHADGDVGVMALGVRKNTAASTSGSDGDYQPLITNTTGHLWVDASGQSLTVGSHAVTNAGTFAVQDSEKIADNAGFTDGTSKVLPAGFIYDDIAGTALTENDAAAGRIDSKRAMVMVIEDSNSRGQRATVSAANALKVTFGTGATDAGKSEDNAHSSSDTGVLALFVRSDTPTSTSGTDGDYTAPITGSRGEHWVGLVRHNTRLEIAVTSSSLTTASTAYTAGDVMGAEMTFANAARISAGGGTLRKIILVNNAVQLGAVNLHLFDSASTPASDNAANSWSDANMLKAVAVVPLVPLVTSANNQVLGWTGDEDYSCAATSLFGVMVTQSGHTFFGAATDILVRMWVERA